MPDEPRDRGLHRHGDPDPDKWEEAEAVTGRPADVPPDNSTLASRAKARVKQVDPDDVEDKAITKAPAKAKATTRKAAPKG